MLRMHKMHSSFIVRHLGFPLLVLTSFVTAAQGMDLIFTQTELEKTIPWDFPPHEDILHVYLMLRPCSEEQIQDITCYVEVTWSNCSSTVQEPLDYPFAFNQSTKSVYWERPFSEMEVKDIGEQCNYDLALQCDSSNETNFQEMKAVIKVISSDPANVDHCLSGKHHSFQVYENTGDVTIGNVAPIPSSLLSSGSRVSSYSISSQPIGLNKNHISEYHLLVNDSTGDVILLKHFDRESSSEIRYILKCHPKTCDTSGSCLYADDIGSNTSHIVTISILDVNDNGPMITRPYQEISGGLQKFPAKKQFLIKDDDSSEVNHYNMYMLGNKSGIFELHKTPKTFPGYYEIDVTRQTNTSLIPELPQYAFDVVFNDTTFCQINAGTQTSKAVFSVKIISPQTNGTVRAKYNLKADIPVYTTDTVYTRVITLKKAIPETPLHNFRVKHGGLFSDIFNVTAKEGIVHVFDADALRSSGSIIENLTLEARLQHAPANYVTIIVEIEIFSTKEQTPAYSKSCSFLKTRSECTKHSAPGTNRCEWRNNTKGEGMGSTYETCSPHLGYCPDRECDELEKLVPVLCPQDCTVDVKGGMLNQIDPPHGIVQGRSPCWCYPDQTCTCMKPLIEYRPYTEAYPIEIEGKTNDVTTSEFNPPAMQKTSYTFCDTSCKMSILGAFLSILLMIVVVTLTCRVFRRKAQSVKLKHIASNVSLSAVTSDYREETEVHEEMSDNRYAPIGVNLKLKSDPKWEVLRQNVVLEKVLGEGEFGKVLKAQILDLPGKKGYSPAAVKMLKEQATIAEFRDLLSEYHLLKDINHKNVIKLLGACTIKGPFMMIVEYCKHGSLKTYLQNCRCQGEVTKSGCVIYKQHNSLGTLVPLTESQAETPIGSPRHSNISTNKTLYTGINEAVEGLTTDDVTAVLTAKDLISFAWQIANGMQYLNEMKVVHRDLAARNILVGASKVVKISDFGLSRDIYVEDHYMKKSKGRVPVKWMAPESLYDHVYTSRSDVWSFGVVLWEIATLGATPYPGVQPERLYSILKIGYRMTKPPGCSNQIFDVMSKCWQFEAMSRPNFKELSNTFEKMLKDKSDYLDLNSICNEEFSSSDDEGVNIFEAQRNFNNEGRHDNMEGMNILTAEQEERLIKSTSNYLVPTQNLGERQVSQHLNFAALRQSVDEFGRKSKHAFNPLYSSDVVNTPSDSPDSQQSRRALVEANNVQNGAFLVPPDANSNVDLQVHRSCPSLNGVLPNGQAPKGMICIFKNGKVKNKTTKNRRRGNEQGAGAKPLVYADIGSNNSVSEDNETEI